MFNNFLTDSCFDYSKLTLREKILCVTRPWTKSYTIYFLNYAPCKEVLKIDIQPKYSDKEVQIRRSICVWLMHRWGLSISELLVHSFEVCNDDLKDMKKETNRQKKSRLRLVK
jgi:hypothetical protein